MPSRCRIAYNEVATMLDLVTTSTVVLGVIGLLVVLFPAYLD
jgi:hypothetical protein